ncbi:MAG: nucleotidyltransferase domain-containing protein [Proteobacteria bacterium]|nr:nucleotidyltransferase domain-containing protein [Pseudomonadota bacterium]
MKYGLTDKEFDYLSSQLIGPLKNLGAKVYMFGSRARGTHRKYSDIDILVESTDDLARVISQLSEKLETGNFPYKVDIVDKKYMAAAYLSSVHADRVEL